MILSLNTSYQGGGISYNTDLPVYNQMYFLKYYRMCLINGNITVVTDENQVYQYHECEYRTDENDEYDIIRFNVINHSKQRIVHVNGIDI